MNSGPDFLCAGMPRSGTGWLFDQLSHHPDFWMPPIKELHYFDTNFPKAEFVVEISRVQKNFDKYSGRRERKLRRPLADRDMAFYQDVLACQGQGINFELYANLFRHKDGQISGDMTPNYCDLDEALVSRIAKAFPRSKILLLVRDPVARFWSRSSMRSRRSDFTLDKFADSKKLWKHLETRTATSAGKQTEIFALWRRHFPADQVQVSILDDISENPARVRSRILSFLGADPAKKSGELEADFNRKSKFDKVDMPDEVRKTLVEYFADEMRKSVEVFGPRATDWLRRYGLGPSI